MSQPVLADNATVTFSSPGLYTFYGWNPHAFIISFVMANTYQSGTFQAGYPDFTIHNPCGIMATTYFGIYPPLPITGPAITFQVPFTPTATPTP
jgi:hypothetical protein